MAPLPTYMFLQYPGRGSQDLRFLPRVQHFLGCDDKCTLSVPLSTNDLNISRWQSGGVCQVLSTGDFTLFCHVFDGPVGVLFFVTFVLLSCSRVCLLDVSRHFGLTLRQSAPVCSCHRDSQSRWRLAQAQEAVRVVSSASYQLFF